MDLCGEGGRGYFEDGGMYVVLGAGYEGLVIGKVTVRFEILSKAIIAEGNRVGLLKQTLGLSADWGHCRLVGPNG